MNGTPGAAAHRALPDLPGVAPALGPGLQHLLCVLVAAAAIKLPLNVPLYWHAILPLIGLFGLVCVQSLPRILLWMIALIALGCVQAVASGTHEAIPRLGQLFLLVMAASVIARLDPDLLIRYLALLLPVIVLIWVVEMVSPEPFFLARKVLGERILRHGGLIGDPNYSAVLYGVIAILLTRRPPRALAILPLLMALPTLSRGVVVALMAWFAVHTSGRFRTRIGLTAIVLLLLQPLVLFLLFATTDPAFQDWLASLSSKRSLIWFAYLGMGLSEPLGVGYFAGPDLVRQLTEFDSPRFAHSLFMQVFGEFGWLGYLIFAAFLIHLVLRIARRCPVELPLVVFLLTAYALVNGLSDWAFWVPVGYLLARLRLAPAAP